MSNHEFNVRGKIARPAAFIFSSFFFLYKAFSFIFFPSFLPSLVILLFGAVVPIDALFSFTDAVQKRRGEEIPLQFKGSV